MDAFFRWGHILAGIIWIGHLYFFNWVNASFVATLDGDTKPKVVPELMPRALYWFRWGAAWTWITGVLLLGLVFYHGKIVLADPAAGYSSGTWIMLGVLLISPFIYNPIADSGIAKNGKAMFLTGVVLVTVLLGLFLCVGGHGYRSAVIHVGATLGTLMAYNVWFKIWPAQQKIISSIKAGEAPDGALAALAGLRSKHNTYMSIPLIWTMINSHTVGFSTWPGSYQCGGIDIPLSLPLAVIIGWAFCAWCYKKGAAVKGF
ncbi:MAG: urate hydroxylase PuuD [Planctomycetota bacterium]|nr:urate hydroxylase PuuD [Planctomycetota bacterium]